MVQVRLRLLPRRDSKRRRQLARTQATKLREDKPHPVPLFPAVAQFLAYLRVHRILRAHETLEVERIIHVYGAAAISPMLATVSPFFMEGTEQI